LIPKITLKNKSYKSIAGEFIYEHVERIVGKEEAPKITDMIIDLPIETLKVCISDYQRLLIKVLYI
jgi:hypothetical protein